MGNVLQNTGGNTLKVLAGGGYGSVGDVTSFTPTAGNLLNSGFESGNMSETNSDGFVWGIPATNPNVNRTSVVTMLAGAPTAIYNNGVISNPDADGTKDWTAKTGSNSLRLRYSAGESMTEQRFDTVVGYPELWVSYWIRVPTNFTRALTGGAANNKWFKQWMGDNTKYDVATEVSQFNIQDWAGTPATNIDVKLNYDNAAGGTVGGTLYPNFVTPADAGKWMHVVYYMKAASAVGAGDGRISFYRRWDGDSAYTTIDDLNNIEVPISPETIANGYAGWGQGYILGWANRPYVAEIEWLVDDFKLSTASLL